MRMHFLLISCGKWIFQFLHHHIIIHFINEFIEINFGFQRNKFTQRKKHQLLLLWRIYLVKVDTKNQRNKGNTIFHLKICTKILLPQQWVCLKINFLSVGRLKTWVRKRIQTKSIIFTLLQLNSWNFPILLNARPYRTIFSRNWIFNNYMICVF